MWKQVLSNGFNRLVGLVLVAFGVLNLDSRYFNLLYGNNLAFLNPREGPKEGFDILLIQNTRLKCQSEYGNGFLGKNRA